MNLFPLFVHSDSPFPEILKHRALDEGSSEGDDGVAIYIRLILCSASLIPAAGEDL